MTDRIENIRRGIREMLNAPTTPVACEPIDVPLAVVKFTRGAKGIDGLNGVDGASGRDGINGRDGMHGARGERGAVGERGTKGLDGVNGLKGEMGADGGAGLTWRGSFREGMTYEAGDVVSLDGSAYVAVDTTTQAPPIGYGWELLAARGSQGASGFRGGDGAAGAAGAAGANGTNGYGLPGYRSDNAQWYVTSGVPRYAATGFTSFLANGSSGTIVDELGTYHLVAWSSIYLTRAVTITKLSTFCGTGGGLGNVIMGIYTSDPTTGMPSTRVYTSGSLPFSSPAGTAISATSVATTLAAGFHYLASTFDDLTPVYTLSAQGINTFGHPTPTNTSVSRGVYTNEYLTFDLPELAATTGTLTIDRNSGTIPAVFFEVSA